MNNPNDESQSGEAVRCSAWLGGVPNPELAAVDADLREYFMADEAARYVPKLPIMIQLVRLMRRLLDKRDDGQNRADHRENAKNDVEPQKLTGQPGGSPLMPVDGLDQAPDKNSPESTLNLLVELGTRLRMVAESLDDLGNRHIDVTALFGGGVAHGVKPPNSSSTQKMPP